MQWVAMVNGGSGLVLSLEHDGDTVGDSVRSSPSLSQVFNHEGIQGKEQVGGLDSGHRWRVDN